MSRDPMDQPKSTGTGRSGKRARIEQIFTGEFFFHAIFFSNICSAAFAIYVKSTRVFVSSTEIHAIENVAEYFRKGETMEEIGSARRWRGIERGKQTEAS